MREGDRKSKCFGFVNSEKADDAARTVEALNGFVGERPAWNPLRRRCRSWKSVHLDGCT